MIKELTEMQLFADAIAERALVCDGAMGTMLYAKGVFVNRSFDELNVSQPGLVKGIHQAYREAGAEVLETNTFGANRPKLESFGLGDTLEELNLEGVRLARLAADGSAYVAGAIGPLGLPIEPQGQTTAREAEAHFREQALALASGGVDLFVLETFRSVEEISAAMRAVHSVCELPVVAQITTDESGDVPDGVSPEAFALRLVEEGATVVGVNCGLGPAATLETVERLHAVTTVPLAAQPNAGLPRHVEGRTMYMSSPDFIASYARRFIRLGVKMVGGCCGTTPEHILGVSTVLTQPV